MTAVYLDPPVVAIGPDERHARLDPTANALLQELVSAGHEVCFIAAPPSAIARQIEVPFRVHHLPGRGPAWVIVGAADRCHGLRARGLASILLGPQPTGVASVERCDLVARDLGAAILEILARDAMAPLD